MGQIQQAVNQAVGNVAKVAGVYNVGIKAGTEAIKAQTESDIGNLAEAAKAVRQTKRAGAVNQALAEGDTKKAQIENMKPDKSIPVSAEEIMAADPKADVQLGRLNEVKAEYEKITGETINDFNIPQAADALAHGRAPAQMDEQFYNKALENLAMKTSTKRKFEAGINAIIGRVVGR